MMAVHHGHTATISTDDQPQRFLDLGENSPESDVLRCTRVK